MMSCICSSNTLMVDYQPGDSTRYVMQLTKWRSTQVGPLGVFGSDYVTLAVINMGLSAEFALDDLHSFAALQAKWRGANPWTVRAALLFLNDWARQYEDGIAIDFSGAPGDNSQAALAAVRW